MPKTAAFAAMLLIAALTPGTANALSTGQPYADRMASRFAVPLPPGPVLLSRTPCPGTHRRDGVICADTDLGVIHFPYRGRIRPFAFGHELGHIFDVRVLTDRDRQLFARLVGYSRGDAAIWDRYTGSKCARHACPGERFADAYANCAIDGVPGVHRIRSGRFRGRTGWDWQSPYGYDPSKRRHRRVCREINRLSPGSSEIAVSQTVVR
jgi:hypothetical protein